MGVAWGGEEGRLAYLPCCIAAGTPVMGTEGRLWFWKRSKGKGLSEPSPFLPSQHGEWVTPLE